MPFFLNQRFSGLIIAVLVLTTPVFAADPKKKGQEKEALPEIVPETPGSKEMPPLEEVLTIVQNYFTGWKGYQPGDFITRNKIKPLFRQLQKAGWAVKEEKNILKRIHSETDYLSRQLSTPKGVKFMRRVSRMPGGYDRLDRLLAMPYGKRNIRDFINSPGGFTMIEYMTTTKGGKNLGKYLSQAKTGKGFNQPTSYIYTETELIQAIKQAYETETGQKKKKR